MKSATAWTEIDDDQLIALKDFAEMLGVSCKTVRRMGWRGDFKIVRLSPRRQGVRMGTARAFIRDREAAAC